MYVVCHVCLVSTEALRGYWTPGTGIIDDYESLRVCWELNLGSVDEQPVL